MRAPPTPRRGARTLEPSSTPPWRVLETPPVDDAARPTTMAPARVGSSVPIKVVAGVVGSVGGAAISVVVAVSGGGGDVRVEGGSPLPGAEASGDQRQADPGLAAASSGGAGALEIFGAAH